MSERMTTASVLSDVLHRNEEIVRALDIKTEVALLCFILSVEAAHSLIDFDVLRTSRPAIAGGLLVFFITTVASYMLVLVPKQNPRIGQHLTPTGAENVRPSYFVPDPGGVTAEILVSVVDNANHEHDLANEILKLSLIRNSKRRRFIAAMWITFVFYALLLTAHLPLDGYV